jgi:predicted MPP superfamily phosphohydrolase
MDCFMLRGRDSLDARCPARARIETRRSRLKAWPVVGIVLMQAILSLAHWFIYHTWIVFWVPLSPAAISALRVAVWLLSMSFIVAALLGFYFSNPLVALLYKVAAVWLGMLNFFFLSACLCWLTALGFKLSGLPPNRPVIAGVLFGLALAACVYGLLNARWIRVRRVAVRLPNLPESWRGRTALLLSDLHLGHINGLRFCRRMVAMAADLRPDIVFIPGDLFDGTEADSHRMAAPFRELSVPFGLYFSTGNHDEFGGGDHYAEVLTRTGIRVLSNEKVVVDGLQIVGVPYGDSTYPIRLRATLESLQLNPEMASILLNHVPNRLPIVEQAGVSLQLSGHTHGGQMFPFSWLTRRVFGKFTYGLQQFGALQVYTSSGAGTWGPPMRVGTHPEIVLLEFE